MAGAIKFMHIFLLSCYIVWKRGEVLTCADAIMTKIMPFFHGFQQIVFVCHRMIAFPSYQPISSA